MILATSLMFDVAARAATPDSILIFFSTLALALFVRETYPANGRAMRPCGTFQRTFSQLDFG